jgi:ketosteroid isomerase-like protein
MGLRSIEFETLRLEYADCLRLACEVGRYRLQIQSDASALETDVGKYVVVHRHQPDGSWRRAVEIFNSNVSVS